MPDTFVGQLDNRTAQVDLAISVVDASNHAEESDETLTVAEKAI